MTAQRRHTHTRSVRRRGRTRITTALLALLAAGAHADVVVVSAWVAEPPPVDVPVAAYVTLRNDGELPVRVARITSPDFSRVEAHETQVVDEVVRMRPVERFEIAPGMTLEMAPGGRHLMLFDGTTRLASGDEVSLTLEFESGRSLDVVADVRGVREAEGAHDHHHHHHHDHQH